MSSKIKNGILGKYNYKILKKYVKAIAPQIAHFML
jgi:hypothetical protein